MFLKLCPKFFALLASCSMTFFFVLRVLIGDPSLLGGIRFVRTSVKEEGVPSSDTSDGG